MRNPEIAKNPSTPTGTRSWRSPRDGMWPVTGQEWQQHHLGRERQPPGVQRVIPRIEYLPELHRASARRLPPQPSADIVCQTIDGGLAVPRLGGTGNSRATDRRRVSDDDLPIGRTHPSVGCLGRGAGFRLRRYLRDRAGFSTRNQLAAASGSVAIAADGGEHERDEAEKSADGQQLLGRVRVDVDAVGQIRSQSQAPVVDQSTPTQQRRRPAERRRRPGSREASRPLARWPRSRRRATIERESRLATDTGTRRRRT